MSTSPLVSVSSFQAHGLTRSMVSYASQNYWIISDEMRDCFIHYYLLEYSPADFIQAMRAGTINGHHVVFKGSCSRGKILAETLQREPLNVVVSYREPHPDYQLLPIALVQFKFAKES